MEGVLEKVSIAQIPATWETANRKKDKSVSLRFTTAFEISNEDFAEMDKKVGNTGWLLFKSNDSEFSDLDIPKDDAPVDIGQKRPSQRLRAVMFIYWKQNTDESEPFDNWYMRQMEKLIDRYKEELS